MTQLCMAIVGMALTAGVMAQAPKPSAKDAKTAAALEGTWVLASINGQPLSDEMTLTIAAGKYHQTVGGTINERGTIRIDASKKPMTIDLAIAEGSDAGKTQLGIVEITGDTIRGNLDTPGAGQRPADFTVKDGTLLFVGTKKK
jgi:uncharacterized protein (TIGR03067 family)